MRWSTRNLIHRRAEINVREAQRLASIKTNPRQIVENILSRQSVCMQVSRELLNNHEAGLDAAVAAIAEKTGYPPEVVRECWSIEVLETGQ